MYAAVFINYERAKQTFSGIWIDLGVIWLVRRFFKEFYMALSGVVNSFL